MRGIRSGLLLTFLAGCGYTEPHQEEIYDYDVRFGEPCEHDIRRLDEAFILASNRCKGVFAHAIENGLHIFYCDDRFDSVFDSNGGLYGYMSYGGAYVECLNGYVVEIYRVE